MGKSGGSWFAAIKRAFMSPAQKRICGSRYDIHHEEHKGRGRKRFQEHTINIDARAADSVPDDHDTDAFAAAMATTEAAEAAVASAKAALEALPLACRPSEYMRDHRAATTIQAAFRAYLARRALNALKGLVKLQAIVRGQNVRKQAQMTLRSVQAMVRVQVQVRDQRIKQLFTNSKPATSSEHFDRQMQTILLEKRNDNDAFRRDISLTSSFSQQGNLWKGDGEIQDQWTVRKQRSSPGRASFDQRDAIKTIEIDTFKPYSASSCHRVPYKTKDIQEAILCSPRASVPHYMSATESAKARVRSQSAPRQRAMTPERDSPSGTKKRLSFPVREPAIHVGPLCNCNIKGSTYTASVGHFVEQEEYGWGSNAYS